MKSDIRLRVIASHVPDEIVLFDGPAADIEAACDRIVSRPAIYDAVEVVAERRVGDYMEVGSVTVLGRDETAVRPPLLALMHTATRADALGRELHLLQGLGLDQVPRPRLLLTRGEAKLLCDDPAFAQVRDTASTVLMHHAALVATGKKFRTYAYPQDLAGCALDAFADA